VSARDSTRPGHPLPAADDDAGNPCRIVRVALGLVMSSSARLSPASECTADTSRPVAHIEIGK
jgi:hypothetical protein